MHEFMPIIKFKHCTFSRMVLSIHWVCSLRHALGKMSHLPVVQEILLLRFLILPREQLNPADEYFQKQITDWINFRYEETERYMIYLWGKALTPSESAFNLRIFFMGKGKANEHFTVSWASAFSWNIYHRNQGLWKFLF